MKINIRFLTVLLGVFIIGIAIYKIGLNTIIETFKHLNLYLFLLSLLCFSLSILFTAFRWNLLLKSFEMPIGVLNSYIYRIMGFSILYTTPTSLAGAESTRAFLASRKNNKSIEKNIHISVMDRSIEILVVLFLTIIILLVSLTYFRVGLYFWLFLFIPLIVLIVLISLLKGSNHKRKGFIGKINGFIYSIKSHLRYLYRFKRNVLIISIVLTILQAFFTVLTFYFIQKMFFNPSLMHAALSYSFSVLASLIPIPLNLGSLESFQLIAFSLMDLSSSIAIGVSLILRLKDLFIALIGGLVFILKGFSVKKEILIDISRAKEWINFQKRHQN